MVLNNGVDKLDLVMKFRVDSFVIFATTDTGMKCFGCGETGHLILACSESLNLEGVKDKHAEQTGPAAAEPKRAGPYVPAPPYGQLHCG